MGWRRRALKHGLGGRGLIPALVGLATVGGVGMASVAFILQNQTSRQLVTQARKDKADAEERLKATEQRLAAMKAKYEKHLTNLLGERRAAEVLVLAQDQDAEGKTLTKVKFLEYSVDGQPMEAKTFTVAGDVVYFDALVMQFKPERVKEGQAKSLYLFRRVFTDQTRPDMGYKIFEPDDSLTVPSGYEDEEVPMEAQREVWAHFARCIADPAYAEEQGVRTIFGQANYKRVRKGYVYTLTIQDNGGLIIEEKPAPTIFQEGQPG